MEDELNLSKELKAQRELILTNHDMLRSIRRNSRISMVLNGLRFLVILVPIVLALIYLPRIVGDYLDLFASVDEVGGALDLPQGFDFSSIQGLLER